MDGDILGLMLNATPHTAGGLFIAVLLALAYRKFTEENGTTAVIQNLRSELERIATLNESLNGAVEKLQGEVFQLRTQNFELKGEIQKLTAQLNAVPCPACPMRGHEKVAA